MISSIVYVIKTCKPVVNFESLSLAENRRLCTFSNKIIVINRCLRIQSVIWHNICMQRNVQTPAK